MARAGRNSFAIATILLLQLGVVVHSGGQDNAPETGSNSTVQSSSESPAHIAESRERVDRVLTLPAVPPSLEEITLHILTGDFGIGSP
jgi:hypothetical protein